MSQVTTPNITRSKGPFFHRKFRDYTNCPPTPGTPKLIATPATRRSNSTKRFKRDPYDFNESITSDYTTPKTTRTPTSTRLPRGKRVTHLVYQPLELDTESSSESTDVSFRRRKLSPTTTTPKHVTKILAIEAPPTSRNSQPKEAKAAPTLTINGFFKKVVKEGNELRNFVNSSDSKNNDNEIIKSNQTILVECSDTTQSVDDSCEPVIIGYKPAKADVVHLEPVVAPRGTTTTDTVVSSEPPTPPITPEKVKEEEEEEISTFVPGNIWIFESISQEKKLLLNSEENV